MTDHDDLDTELERSLRRSLDRVAPRADAGLAERLLARTAAEPQRRRASLFSGFPGALAVAVAALAAIVVGFSLSALPRSVGGDPSPTATVEVTTSPTVAPPTSTPTPTREATPSPEASPAGRRCANEAAAFEVTFPADWHTNEEVPQQSAEPTPACTYFGPQPMEILPNAGLPDAVAIIVRRVVAPAPGPDPTVARLVHEAQATVAGRPARVEEWEWTRDTVFERAGDRIYAYEVELSDGSTLVATTTGTDPTQHADRKAVLDAMMGSLVLR